MKPRALSRTVALVPLACALADDSACARGPGTVDTEYKR